MDFIRETNWCGSSLTMTIYPVESSKTRSIIDQIQKLSNGYTTKFLTKFTDKQLNSFLCRLKGMHENG